MVDLLTRNPVVEGYNSQRDRMALEQKRREQQADRAAGLQLDRASREAAAAAFGEGGQYADHEMAPYVMGVTGVRGGGDAAMSVLGRVASQAAADRRADTVYERNRGDALEDMQKQRGYQLSDMQTRRGWAVEDRNLANRRADAAAARTAANRLKEEYVRAGTKAAADGNTEAAQWYFAQAGVKAPVDILSRPDIAKLASEGADLADDLYGSDPSPKSNAFIAAYVGSKGNYQMAVRAAEGQPAGAPQLDPDKSAERDHEINQEFIEAGIEAAKEGNTDAANFYFGKAGIQMPPGIVGQPDALKLPKSAAGLAKDIYGEFQSPEKSEFVQNFVANGGDFLRAVEAAQQIPAATPGINPDAPSPTDGRTIMGDTENTYGFGPSAGQFLNTISFGWLFPNVDRDQQRFLARNFQEGIQSLLAQNQGRETVYKLKKIAEMMPRLDLVQNEQGAANVLSQMHFELKEVLEMEQRLLPRMSSKRSRDRVERSIEGIRNLLRQLGDPSQLRPDLTGGAGPAGAPTPPAAGPSRQEVEELRPLIDANPQILSDFEAQWGPGSALRHLGRAPAAPNAGGVGLSPSPAPMGVGPASQPSSGGPVKPPMIDSATGQPYKLLPESIEMLRRNPALAPEFEAVYGTEALRRVQSGG